MNDSERNGQTDVDVLVVGAGPTGLTLACDLARRGVSVQVVEKLPQPITGSRAKGLQPRTLEVFDDLGVVEAILAAGGAYPKMRIHLGPLAFSRDFQKQRPATVSVPYPNIWMVPQARTEAILRARFEALGGRVVMGAALSSVAQDAGGVTATVATAKRATLVRARYLVGADGGHSLVRKAIGVEFSGKSARLGAAVVGDLRIEGLDRRYWHAWPLAKWGPVALCPLPQTGLFQLFHQVDASFAGKLTAASVEALLAQSLGRPAFVIRAAPWLSLYRPNARLAAHYRVGRIFLAGDAAHVHPPTGAQGMNAGVQDAYNLGWKLEAVLGGASDALLDTYETERREVAADILGMSTALYRNKWRARGDAQNQLKTSYRSSALAWDSDPVARDLRAGDRLPDARITTVAGESLRVFDLLRGPHSSLFAFGAEAARVATEACASGSRGREIEVVRAQSDARKVYGLGEDALLLVRPDGYVGFTGRASAPSLNAYLDRFWC